MSIFQTSTHHALMATTGLAILAASSVAEAAIFPTINVGSAPDITSTFISTNYDATTDLFTATGFATEYLFDDGMPKLVLNGMSTSYSLSATIDDAGIMSGGMITIMGDATDDSILNVTTLLTGDLSMFLSGDASDAFEFIFDVTGGDLAGVFGSTAGTILSNPGFGGDFMDDFSNTFAISDTAAVVPVPAAAWLFMSGLIGLIGTARRKV